MRWLVLVAAAVLAGCLEAGETDDAVVEDPLEVVPETERFEARFDLLAQQVSTPVTRSGFNQDNCFQLTGIDALRNATLTAEWDAMTPLAENLEIVVIGDEWAYTGEGPSPLVLEIEELAPGDVPDGRGFMVSVQTGSPGATVQQEVTLDVAFDHSGSPVIDEGWSCTASHS